MATVRQMIEEMKMNAKLTQPQNAETLQFFVSIMGAFDPDLPAQNALAILLDCVLFIHDSLACMVEASVDQDGKYKHDINVNKVSMQQWRDFCAGYIRLRQLPTSSVRQLTDRLPADHLPYFFARSLGSIAQYLMETLHVK